MAPCSWWPCSGPLGGGGALLLLSTMSRNVDVRVHGMQLWAAVIAVVGLGLTIGGYLDAIEPDDSLDTLTLVAVLTSILVGLGVLLGAPRAVTSTTSSMSARPSVPTRASASALASTCRWR